MPIYMATFKSGSHQFFEMDDESLNDLSEDLRAHREYWDVIKAGGVQPESTMPSSVFLTDTGAVIDLEELAGFQFHIPEDYAESRFYEDNEQDD